MTVVGRVAALWRYPVKSMAAEGLDGVEVSWHGLAGDRRWAFICDGQVRCGFPWLTIRERPELAHYRPRFTEPDRPNASPTLVRTPSGGELDVADPALAAELGPGVRIIKQDRGVFDTMPGPGDPARRRAGTRQPARGLRLDGGTGPGHGGRPGRSRTLSPPGAACDQSTRSGARAANAAWTCGHHGDSGSMTSKCPAPGSSSSATSSPAARA
jgi:hypothetical protein